MQNNTVLESCMRNVFLKWYSANARFKYHKLEYLCFCSFIEIFNNNTKEFKERKTPSNSEIKNSCRQHFRNYTSACLLSSHKTKFNFNRIYLKLQRNLEQNLLQKYRNDKKRLLIENLIIQNMFQSCTKFFVVWKE